MERLSIVTKSEMKKYFLSNIHETIHYQRLSIIIAEDEDMLESDVIGFPSKLFHNSDNSLRELQIGKWPKNF